MTSASTLFSVSRPLFPAAFFGAAALLVGTLLAGGCVSPGHALLGEDASSGTTAAEAGGQASETEGRLSRPQRRRATLLADRAYELQQEIEAGGQTPGRAAIEEIRLIRSEIKGMIRQAPMPSVTTEEVALARVERILKELGESAN